MTLPISNALVAAMFLGAFGGATPSIAQSPRDASRVDDAAVERLLDAHHVDPAWLATWRPNPNAVALLLQALEEDSILRHRKRAAAALALAPLDDSRVEARLTDFLGAGEAQSPNTAEVPAALRRQATSTLLLRAQRRGRLETLARQLARNKSAVVREEVLRVAGESDAVPASEVLQWAKGSPRLMTIARRAIARRPPPR